MTEELTKEVLEKQREAEAKVAEAQSKIEFGGMEFLENYCGKELKSIMAAFGHNMKKFKNTGFGFHEMMNLLLLMEINNKLDTILGDEEPKKRLLKRK